MESRTVLDGDAIENVAELAKRAAEVQEFKYTTPGGNGERRFTDKTLVEVRLDPRMPEAIKFGALTPFRDYLLADEAATGLLVCVVSPYRVDAFSKLEGTDKHLRRLVAIAECQPSTAGFRFNAFEEMSPFNIALQTCFVPSEGRIEELRKFSASVKADAEIRIDDDGFSQQVTAKAGVAAVTGVQVQNPWELAPWRTFAEVEQPLSPFILRFQREDGEPVEAGLFETGNQQWRNVAIARVAAWLRTGMPGWKVLG